MRSVFSTAATVGAILEFEMALALALADAGVAPEDESLSLVAACREPVADSEAILAETWMSGTPIISLRDEISARVDESVGRWFHYGATTQDAIDTGLMLQSVRGLELIERDLVALGARLRDLTVEFRDQPQVGRTFLQTSRPTTFGLRTSWWLNSVLDHHQGLRDLGAGLPVQLGGADGRRSVFGNRGSQVVSHLADRLGLAPSAVTWHSDRTVILALVQSLERVAKTMAKIGGDIAILASSAVAEVSVRSGGSSSMPGKENPMDSVRAIAAASACSGAVTMLTGAPPPELDRGIGSWHVEWLAVPLAFGATAAAVEAMRGCLHSLEVDSEAMGSHVVGEVTPGGDDQIDAVLTRAGSILT